MISGNVLSFFTENISMLVTSSDQKRSEYSKKLIHLLISENLYSAPEMSNKNLNLKFSWEQIIPVGIHDYFLSGAKYDMTGFRYSCIILWGITLWFPLWGLPSSFILMEIHTWSTLWLLWCFTAVAECYQGRQFLVSWLGHPRKIIPQALPQSNQ